MARRRRQKITYDSQETRSLFGLLAILAALAVFIAALADPAQAGFFTQIRQFFGHTTILAAVFFLNIGLWLLGSKLPFASRSSILGQFVLVLLVPALLSSLYLSKALALSYAEVGAAGGRLGYEIAFGIFGDTLVFGQFTPLILFLAVLIFLPIALSMSVAKSVQIVWSVISTIFGVIISGFQKAREMRPARAEKEEIAPLPSKATRFGDFQRQPVAQQTSNNVQQRSESTKPQTESVQPDIKQLAKDANVEIKEAELGDNGLSQSQLNYPDWRLPPLSLLKNYKKIKPKDADTERNAQIIEQTLSSFGVDANVAEAFVGPAVVRYALNIPLGIKVDKVANLAPTLALGLGVDSKAIRVDNIPGTTYLGIEVPRQSRDFVQIREIMESESMQSDKLMLPVPVGKDIDGDCIVTDIQKMPHLLIAGSTGSGKSVLTNSFIVSLLMRKTPDELRLILVDPKQVELMDYNGIPHLLTPVIVDMDKVVNALKWAVGEMERRYTVLASAQVRNLEDYNKKAGFAAMPFIVVVIDEMADMMMTANRVEAENAIVRLTQKARAVGIHLILATQRPSVNVITGLIKANVPARIGMSVASAVDSRVILDAQGAESLQGKGDLLYNSPGLAKLMRLQGPSVDGEEIMNVVNYIKSQVPEVQYVTSILESHDPKNSEGDLGDLSGDDQFAAAVRVVVNSQKGSASFLQRKLGVGFNRAARMLEEMEELGIVGPANGSKPREVLISDADTFLAQLNDPIK